VKENDVGLDAEITELGDALLEVAEKRGIKLGEIPRGGRRAGEGVEDGLVLVPVVVFGENAEADLVERGGGEGAEGLFFEGVAEKYNRSAKRGSVTAHWRSSCRKLCDSSKKTVGLNSPSASINSSRLW
jgi:hypothetical protein